MNAFRVVRALGPIDLRSIWRDSMMGWMTFIPIISAFVLRWAIPPVTTALLRDYNFDLTVYYPVILAYFFIMMCPLVFAVLVGFLLLDEKDDQTLIALQVAPISNTAYITYRVLVPIILSIVLMFAIFPIANLGTLDMGNLFLAALVASPLAPWFGLGLATFAQNKVQGFALMKGVGFLFFLPIFAYFIQSAWHWVFAIFPTFWPMKVYWMLTAGESGVWWVATVGLIYQIVIILLLGRRFNKILHQ